MDAVLLQWKEAAFKCGYTPAQVKLYVSETQQVALFGKTLGRDVRIILMTVFKLQGEGRAYCKGSSSYIFPTAAPLLRSPTPLSLKIRTFYEHADRKKWGNYRSHLLGDRGGATHRETKEAALNRLVSGVSRNVCLCSSFPHNASR